MPSASPSLTYSQSTSRRRAWSLALRLPLLMTGLLAAMLAVVLGVTYVTLTRSAMAAASAGLDGVAGQVGRLAGGAVVQYRATLTAAAGATAIRRAAEEGAGGSRLTDMDSVRAELEALLPRGDTTLVAGLWSTDGRLVASAGRTLERSAPDPEARPGEDPGIPYQGGVPGLPDAGDLARSSTVMMGDLYVSDGVPHFWMVAPVIASGRRVGYLARQHRISGGPRLDRAIRDVSGADIRTYYRNRTGDVWVTIVGEEVLPPDGRDSLAGRPVSLRTGVGPLLTLEEPVTDDGTLILVVERPVASVLAAPRAVVRRLAMASLLVLLVGAVAAWFVSRRITAPLGVLTRASEAMAQGDFETRVEPAGDDELVRLAESFNRMVAEVGAAHSQLEAQTEEAEAAAEELDRSNVALAAARETAESARVDAEAARTQAESANQAKSEFLAVMSHELRTPLNAIGGYTELLELGLRGPVNDAQRRDLERIRINQQHLLGLISGVLDLSRIEAGRVSYNLAPVRLTEFLEGLNGLVEPQAMAKELALEHSPCDPGLAVLADREKLRQVLLNLLSNAIRYTPAGGRVELTATAADDEWVAITVRDTGVGISEDSLEQIFHPFVQLDRSLTQVRDGVGLGLAISLDLARGMGGDISVESRPGDGSRFTVRLPRPEVAADVPDMVSGEWPVAEQGDAARA